MKIKCFILRKDRTVTAKKISPDKGVFRFNDGLYVLNKKAVNLEDTHAIPELIYIEGNPNPLIIEEKKDVDKSTKTKNEKKEPNLLDAQVMKNALKVSGRPRGLAWDIIGDYMRDPFKILILVFAIIIFMAFIGGLFR